MDTQHAGTLQVQRMAPDDWRLAREVRLACIRDGFGPGSDLYREQAGMDEAAWRIALTRHARFVALLDGRPEGCTGWRPSGEGSGHLYGMWVHPGARRRGAGAALLGAVVSHGRARGDRLLSLQVEPGNVRARRLYERHGFAAVAPAEGAPPELIELVLEL